MDDRFEPNIAIPPSVKDFDPTWKNCEIYPPGTWDPPFALTAASHDLDPTDVPTSASPAPTISPLIPSKTTKGPGVTLTPIAEPINHDGNTPAPNDPDVKPEPAHSAPDHQENHPPQADNPPMQNPHVPENGPKQNEPPSDIQPPPPNSNQAANPRPHPQDPSSPKPQPHVIVTLPSTTLTITSPLSNPTDPIAIPITLEPGSVVTLSVSGPAITLPNGGGVLSLNPSGIVQDDITHQFSTPAPTPAPAMGDSAPGPNGVEAQAGQVVTLGGSPITILPLPFSSPTTTGGTGGGAAEGSPAGVVVAGQTLIPGGEAVTIAGTIVSVATDGRLIIGGSTTLVVPAAAPTNDKSGEERGNGHLVACAIGQGIGMPCDTANATTSASVSASASGEAGSLVLNSGTRKLPNAGWTIISIVLGIELAFRHTGLL